MVGTLRGSWHSLRVLVDGELVLLVVIGFSYGLNRLGVG